MKKIITDLFYLTGFVVFVLAGIFAVFYYTSGSDYLTRWYFGMNECIYRREHWLRDFFTPQVKETGDWFCMAAFVLSISGIAYIIRKWPLRTLDYPRPGQGSRGRYLSYVVLGLISIFLGLYSHSRAASGYDEVFSAVHSAETHPFQTISYYMLPNNHLFFNLLNGIIFHPFQDKVLTGRLLSLAAYTGVVLLAYYWFRSVMKNSYTAFIAALVIALQFPVWGFSAQARGYELQLLAGWVCFVSLFRFCATGEQTWLRCLSFATVIGYITVPTFLFFHAAIISFILLRQVYTRRWDMTVWKYQVFCLVAIFLFYLPAICFSGLGSLTANPYVRPQSQQIESFFPLLIAKLEYGTLYGFGVFSDKANAVSYVLLLIPLALVFVGSKQTKHLALFYLLLWLSFLSVDLLLRAPVPHRALILQHSITLALIIYFAYLSIQFLLRRWQEHRLHYFSYTGLLIGAGIHFIISHSRHIDLLYGPDSDEVYQTNIRSMQAIPGGSSMAFSHESFYWYYHCRRLNYRVAKCPAGEESYYVKRVSEPLPSWYESYVLIHTNGDNYQVYKR